MDPLFPSDAPAPSQLDTFRGWVNLKLREASFRSPLPPERRVVRDLSLDLCDGVLLAELCGALSGLREPLKIHYQPRVSSRKLENIHTSLSALQQQGVRLPQIGPEDILRGDLRAVAGLLWSLIVRYQLSGDAKRPAAKKSVLAWIRAALPNENIPDLATSWNDGILLSKLIAYLAPTSHTLLDPSNHTATCGMLLTTAKRDLGVPDIISAESLSSCSLAEEAVCTYLSLFSVAMSASLLGWLRGLLGASAPRALSPEEWRNGDLLGRLVQARSPGAGGQQRDLSDLFGLLRERMDITPPVTPRELREGRADLLSLQTLLLQIRHAGTDSSPGGCAAVGRGLVAAVAGESATFLVDTRAGGRGQLGVEIRYKSGDRVEHAEREDNRVHNVSYCPDRAGHISVAVLWGGKHIPNSPFSILATNPAAVRLVDNNNSQKEIQVAREHEVLVSTEGAGEGELTGQVVYPSQQLEKLDSVRRGTALMALVILPKKEGEVTLHILWNDNPIPDSPVRFAALLPPSYSLDPASPPRDPETGDLLSVPIREAVCLCVRSRRGRLSQLTAEVRHSQSGQLLPVATETHRNYSNLWVTPERTGVYRVSLLAAGEHIAGSPLALPVSDGSHLILLSPPVLPRCLQLICPMELSLGAEGAGPAKLSFHCQRGIECTIFRTGDSIVATLLPGTIGEYSCSLKWGSQHIKGSPFRVTVCDITQVSVTSEVLEGELGVVGEELEFIILFELAGASADNDVRLLVSARGPTANCPVETLEEGLGHTVASLTPREAGEHQLEVLLGDIELEQSPLYFDVVASDTMDITAYGNGLMQAESGAVSEFFIRSRDSGPLEEGRLGVRVHSIHGEVRHWLEERGQGDFRVEYTPKRPGAYLVEVSMDGAHISGSPFKVSVHPDRTGEYTECLLSGPALNPDNKFTLGQPVDFTVDATRASAAQLAVSAVGERGLAARVVMHQYRQGFYQVNLDPPEAGLYSVSVRYGDKESTDSPFSVEISPSDTDSSQCRAYGPGLEQAKVGERTEFFVSTHAAGRGALAVTVEGFGRSFVVYVDPTAEDSRLLCCRYKPQSSGAYSIALKWSGQNIPGSPFQLDISGKALAEGSGLSLADSLADSVRQAQATGPEGYASSDDNTSLGDYTRPPPTPQPPLVPLPPSHLPDPLAPLVPIVPLVPPVPIVPPVPPEGTEREVSPPHRGRVLAQITQFEKQARTEEPAAGRRASEKWRSLRRGTQESARLGGIKETAVKEPTKRDDLKGVDEVAEKGVDKVAEKGVDKVTEKGVNKVAEKGVDIVEETGSPENIKRGVVSGLVQQRASIFESPSLRHLREGAHVRRTKEQLAEKAKQTDTAPPPSLDTGEPAGNVAAGRVRDKAKPAEKAKRKSADKKSKRDTGTSHESEESEKPRKKGETRDKKKEKGVSKRGAETAEKNVSFSAEVATHHIPKEKQWTGIFGMFEKKEQKQRKLAPGYRQLPPGSVPASIHQQQKIAQRHQQFSQGPYRARMPYAPQMLPAYYPVPMPQYVVYPPGPYHPPQPPQPQRKGTPGHYMENFAEQTNLYY